MTEETQDPANAETTTQDQSGTDEAVTLAGKKSPTDGEVTESTADDATSVERDVASADAGDNSDADLAAAEAPSPDGETADAPGTPSEGKTEATEGKTEAAPKKEKPKKPPQALARFFGKFQRQTTFKAGELVAGIVRNTDDGCIELDLFGRGTAFVDAREAHEIEELPEAAPEPEAPVSEDMESPEGEVASEAENQVEAGAKPEAVGAEGLVAESAPNESADDATEASSEAVTEARSKGATEGDDSGDVVDGATAELATSADDAESTDSSVSKTATSKAATTGNNAQPEVEPASLEPDWPAPELPAVGSVFYGRVGSVTESGHMALVNRAVDRPATKAGIRLARTEQRKVDGVVFGYNRGGFDVLVSGVRCFCPAGSLTLGPIDNPDTLLGKKMKFAVPPARKGRSIILSRRGILRREQRNAAQAFMKALKVGEKRDGVITDVRDYGLLVDIGNGVEGLVHQSEVSWDRALQPKDVAKKGDKVEVEILKITLAKRKDRYGKVGLSIKRCQDDPWIKNAEGLEVGVPMKGKITRTAEFGAFVELIPGVEGLLHITELGRDLKHASDAVSEGDELDVVIESKELKRRRLSLTKLSAEDLAAIEAGELDLTKAPSLKQGKVVHVRIERVERGGLRAQVEGTVGKRGRGFIRSRELPENRERGAFQPGSVVEAKIVGVNRGGELKLSVTAMLRDEERKAVRDYQKSVAAQGGLGTFADLLKGKLKQ